MQRTLLLLTILCFTQMLFAQISFTDGSSLLADPGFRSYQSIAIIDMNGDGRDDIVRAGLPTSDISIRLNIEYQNPNGGLFSNYQCPTCTFGVAEPYSIVVGDIDKNGQNDILYGGNSSTLKYLKANGTGTAYASVSYFSFTNIKTLNFVDIDNDSDLDAFGCNNDGLNVVMENQGGGLSLNNGFLPTEPSGGNNASIWTDVDNDGDIDLYISRSKAGENSPTANSRLNRLYINGGNMVFTESAASFGVQNGGQTRAADFADIDNDGDLDLFLLNNEGGNELYVQLGNPLLDPRSGNGAMQSSGNFVSVINSSGIDLNGANYLQSIFTDFDNDGYVDLLLTGFNPKLYRNNGDGTFTSTAMPAMKNAALGDFNNDGFVDIYSSMGAEGTSNTADKMYLNDGNANNFMCFRLEGTLSNPNAVGTKLLFYGDWGVQEREVRAGEGFGVQNSTTARFGMGNFSSYDSLVIQWPTGPRQIVPGVFPANFCHFIREGHPILSVELVSFEANLKDESVLLEWETANEEGHGHFEVQRSKDGSDFRTIGEVYEPASEGNFNSYRFVDGRPEIGNNYYRLKMVDVEGEFEYSEIRVVKTEFSTQVILAPNPIKSGQAMSVQVVMPEFMHKPNMRYDLFDLAGRNLFSEEITPDANLTTFDLDSYGLTPGVYFLRFTFDGEFPETHKFIVTQ